MRLPSRLVIVLALIAFAAPLSFASLQNANLVTTLYWPTSGTVYTLYTPSPQVVGAATATLTPVTAACMSVAVGPSTIVLTGSTGCPYPFNAFYGFTFDFSGTANLRILGVTDGGGTVPMSGVTASSTAITVDVSALNFSSSNNVMILNVASGYNLNVALAGTGTGSVTSSPAGINCPGTCTQAFPGSVTLTAAAAAGSYFAGWSGGSPACSGTGTCTVDTSLAAQSVTATFTLIAPPTMAKSFAKSAIELGEVTTMTFVLTNPNPLGVTLTGVGFTDTLPTGITTANPGTNSWTCSPGGTLGTVTAPAGSTSVSVSGFSIAGGGTCTINIAVLGTITGPTVTNTTSMVSSNSLTLGAPASAQITVQPNTTSYQLQYFTMQYGSGIINLTNAGSVGDGTDPSGTLCAHFYAFDPNEEMMACCSCAITPNGLRYLSVREDIYNKMLVNNPPTSITVKVLTTTVPSGGCNAATTPSNPQTLSKGLKLWGTTLHTLQPQGSPLPPALTGMTETPFARAELTTNELTKLSTYCRYVQILGSQFTGICSACQRGAIGGAKQ